MKVPLKTASWIIAALCWGLLSILAFFLILGMRDRARLIRDNDNEQLLNVLFTSLRGYEDFGSAIEDNPVLRERIAGFAVFGNDLKPAYEWGKVPPVFDEEELERNGGEQNGRYTIPDKRGRTVKFVLHTERMAPLPPPPDGERNWGRPPDAEQGPNGEPGRDERQDWAARRQGRMVIIRQDFRFFNTLASGKYYYIDIFHPAYWRTITVMNVLLPVSCLLLLVLVFYIRSLYVRNREYQERIDSQKNLVVLGSAASTLAHEIKNPLLSIRLQTGILEKIFANSEPSAETGREELGIINEEVDRLSALSYRINDYIRDAAGEPAAVNSYTVLEEICRRLCGRNSITADSVKDGMIFVDPDRLRSVFENLLRNALESGGDSEEVGASIARGGGNIIITVFDRGKGVAAEDLKRVFDPFFTRKSTGTGIGLGISRRFVEAAGGTITLENRDGGGAAARITLPDKKSAIF